MTALHAGNRILAGVGRRGVPRTSRHYALNAGAVLYIVIAVFLAIGAVNSQNNLLYIAFGVALSAMIVSGYISGSALVGISVRRDPLSAARAGEPIAVRYTIENRRRLPAFGLIVSERFSGEREPRVTASVISLPGKGAARVRGSVRVDRRGLHAVEEVRITSTFPFGLLRKTIAVAQRDELLVGPRRAVLRPGALPAPRGIGRQAQRREAPISGADEFVGLREYTPGDPLRRIAWKPSARLDTLVVRQTNSATPPAVRIVIDAHDLTEPWRFERSLVLAAAAAERAASRGALVGLSIPGCGIEVAPTADLSDGGALVRALASASIEPAEDGATAMLAGGHPVTRGAKKGGSVVTVGPSGEATLREQRLEKIAELEHGAGGSAPELAAPVETPRRGVLGALARKGAS